MSELSWPIEVTEESGIRVVRDDLLAGGSKRRFLSPLVARIPENEIVFGGPAEGYAQLALGWAARDTGKRATFFIAERKQEHALTLQGRELGVRYVGVRPGYLGVVQKRSRDYAAEVGARFFPLGFAAPDVEEAAVEALAPARELIGEPSQVWCVAGSGFLSRCLQRVWPEAEHIAVRIGMPPDVGRAELLYAPEEFKHPADRPPPFPSCAHYDAKAWRFIASRAKPGALFWNVGR